MNILLLIFCGTAAYAISRITDPDLEAVNFARAIHGKKLNGSVFQESSVDSEISCQLACVKETRCLSYNFGAMKNGDGLICQLSDSDRLTSHENFTRDEKVTYRGIQVSYFETQSIT